MKKSAKRQSISPTAVEEAPASGDEFLDHKQERKRQKTEEGNFSKIQRVCKELVEDLKKMKDENGRIISELFLTLPCKKLYPDYYVLIKDPISIAEIVENIDKQKYQTIEEFCKDCELMFSNAYSYNEEGSFVYEDAKHLERELGKLVEIQKASLIKQKLKIKVSKEDVNLLSDAIFKNDFKLFQDCLKKKKFDPNEMIESNIFQQPCKWSSLHCAAFYGRTRMIPLLIESGAKLEATDTVYDGTPLAWSAFNNQYKAARLLVEEFHANIHARNADGLTPFQLLTPEAISENSLWIDILLENIDLEIPTEMPSIPDQSSIKGMKMIYGLLMDQKDANGRDICEIFMEIPSRKEFPEYYTKIKNPMAFSIVAKKLHSQLYSSFEEFVEDVNLIYQNAQTFNPASHFIHQDAKYLQDFFKLACDAVKEKKLKDFIRCHKKKDEKVTLKIKPIKAPKVTIKLSSASSTESLNSASSNTENVETQSNQISDAILNEREEMKKREEKAKARRKSAPAPKTSAIFAGENTLGLESSSTGAPPALNQQFTRYIRASSAREHQPPIISVISLQNSETLSKMMDFEPTNSKHGISLCVPFNTKKIKIQTATSTSEHFHSVTLQNALFNQRNKEIGKNTNNDLESYQCDLELEVGMNVLELHCSANADEPHFLAGWDAQSNKIVQVSDAHVMRPADINQTFRVVIIRL